MREFAGGVWEPSTSLARREGRRLFPWAVPQILRHLSGGDHSRCCICAEWVLLRIPRAMRCWFVAGSAFGCSRSGQPEQVLESMLAGIPAILKIYSRQFRAGSPPILSTFAPKRRGCGANRCAAAAAAPGQPCRRRSSAPAAIPAMGDAIGAIPAESGVIAAIPAAVFPPQLIRSAPFPPDLAGILPDRVGNHAPERRSTGGKPSIAGGGNCG